MSNLGESLVRDRLTQNLRGQLVAFDPTFPQVLELVQQRTERSNLLKETSSLSNYMYPRS